MEIKFSDTPSLSRGNRLAMQDVGADLNLIVTPNGEDYPLEEGIRVCDLRKIGKYLR